jgi:lipoprotein-anchoring transpeptidase ErfK/SrfK
MKKSSQTILIGSAVIVVGFGVFYAIRHPHNKAVPTTSVLPAITSHTTPAPAQSPTTNTADGHYYAFTLKTNDSIKELSTLVGAGNVETILKLNRINSEYVKKDSVLIVAHTPEDWMTLSPFPLSLPAAATIPKLDMISQRVQAFGVYEYGTLVRWGPVSTGKQSTPTASKLYFTNWKSEEIASSFNNEWILKWNFNLDNTEGIGMHEYTMPGYPASHSCVRMFETDAKWLYNWADQWVVSADGQTVVTHGTPVLVFGNYVYGKTAPWKLLPKDPTATTLSAEELTAALNPELAVIAQYKK